MTWLIWKQHRGQAFWALLALVTLIAKVILEQYAAE